ncbi:MAG: sigma-E factor negative regulatory protein [Steroidobacteraceae bacterium]
MPETPMTDQIREQLSALLDGELPRDEIGLLMRRVERDADLRRAFGSYALIGETLRAPGGQVASAAFAARVGSAIDGSASEAAPASAGVLAAPGGKSFWKRPVVRTALAAGAAATAVFLLRPDTASQPLAQAGSGADAPPGAYAAASYSPTPAQAQRLASYMVAHSQYSTPMVRRNVLSGLLAADPGLTNVSFDMGEAR